MEDARSPAPTSRPGRSGRRNHYLEAKSANYPCWAGAPCPATGTSLTRTQKVFDSDGWLRTGDLGFVDEAGYVHFVDRLKDIVRPGGENVSSSEVEATLLAHPAIQQASVIRIPDPVLGEVPGAAVRVKSGSDVTGETLRAWCERKLAAFKIPRRIWIVAEFPMTESGKVAKRLLEQQLLGPGSWPRWLGTVAPPT